MACQPSPLCASAAVTIIVTVVASEVPLPLPLTIILCVQETSIAITIATPPNAFTVFASTLCTMHLATALKNLIGATTPSGVAYSATTLDDEQRRERDEIDRRLREINELIKKKSTAAPAAASSEGEAAAVPVEA